MFNGYAEEVASLYSWHGLARELLMQAPRFTRLQLAVHIGAWLPLVSLVIAYLTTTSR